jgi:molecular chaperone DnaJ
VRQEQRTIFGVFASVGVCPTCHGEGKKPEKFCSKCHGDGRVKNKKEVKIKIPAGIDENQSIRVEGAGNAGPKGSRAGDLYISFRISPDKIFTREGENILTKIEINIAQAALGDKIEIETLDGAVEMKIPEGTQSGKIFILKDRGVPILNSHGRGDQLVEVVVKVPTKLSKKEKQLLEELKKEWK